MSLCHSVSKKNSVFTCPYVILSLKNTLSLYVFMSFCLLKNTLSLLVPMLFCLQNILTKTLRDTYKKQVYNSPIISKL